MKFIKFILAVIFYAAISVHMGCRAAPHGMDPSGSFRHISGVGSDKPSITFSAQDIAWTEANITNFETLSEDQKKPILYIVSLFSNYLKEIGKNDRFLRAYCKSKKIPIFKKTGVSIILLREGQKVTDVPEMSHLRGKKVRDVYFDYGNYYSGNRLMENLEAEGSHRFLVIERKLLTDKIHGLNNTFYHEFAHFIQLTTFSRKQMKRLNDLYLNAKSNGLFLDDYAAANDEEYFAVGLEAYLSEIKPNEKWIYYKHTKEEVEQKDPELFAFISDTISYGSSVRFKSSSSPYR